MASLNNVITQLFDIIESKSGVTFASFTTNESTPESTMTTGKAQPYMQGYTNTQSTSVYKYLYDPELSFDFRFHQRLASINYTERNLPWTTILFNTGQVRPLTGVLSHKYEGYEKNGSDVYSYKTRRVSVPVNMVLVSNNLTYLYNVTEKLAIYFDRIVNFHYDESIPFSDTFTQNYELSGMAKGIHQVDLTKLDTQNRGNIVTSAFYFDLIYFVTDVGYTGGLLEEVIVEIKVKDHATPLTINITS